MSTRPTYSDRVSKITLNRSWMYTYKSSPAHQTFFHLVRCSEATRGIATHGGVVQSGKAEKKGDAAQVRFSCVMSV